MPASDRSLTRAAARAQRTRSEIAFEFRQARIRSGLSQHEVARRLGWSGTKVCRVEAGNLISLSIDDAHRLAGALGLELAVRLFPGGEPSRDAAQAKRVGRLLAHVAPRLRPRTDAPLPQRSGERPERRAWDVLLDDSTERTVMEFESRLNDVQELTRRHNLKRRDDPAQHFLLVVADTVHNRRVLREYAALFSELPRLRTANVLAQLRAGRHPPTGLMLF